MYDDLYIHGFEDSEVLSASHSLVNSTLSVGTEMSEAVTYADLRFVELPLKEIKPFDDLVETEDGEVMYENVSGAAPPRSRANPPERPTALEKPLWTGLWARTSLLSLLHLLLSLMLVASTIGLAVKYIDVSHQFHNLSESHTELTQRLQRKENDLEATENILESMQKETKELILHLNTSLLECHWTSKESTDEKVQLVRDKDILNTSLLECQRATKKSTEDMENCLQNITSQIEKQKDFCPDGWILFGRKCLLISEEKKSWWESQRYCEDQGSNLLVAERDDAAVKNLSLKYKLNFWVGKIFVNFHYPRWNWPSSLEWLNWNQCWMISEGTFLQVSCDWPQHIICEKNLVVTSLTKYYDGYFSFRLWKKVYNCKTS